MLSSEASTGYPDKFGIPNSEIEEVQELSLKRDDFRSLEIHVISSKGYSGGLHSSQRPD